MPNEPAAVGVALHTAWVAVVALVLPDRLVHRGRIDLIAAPLPAQPYHAAAEGGLDLPAAEDFIRRWLDRATTSARAGLQQVAQAVQTSGGQLRACALFGQPKPLPPLDRILASHPLLHAAEGQLSREALAAAAGPPWAADQRHAAAAALIALGLG